MIIPVRCFTCGKVNNAFALNYTYLRLSATSGTSTSTWWRTTALTRARLLTSLAWSATAAGECCWPTSTSSPSSSTTTVRPHILLYKLLVYEQQCDWAASIHFQVVLINTTITQCSPYKCIYHASQGREKAGVRVISHSHSSLSLALSILDELIMREASKL